MRKCSHDKISMCVPGDDERGVAAEWFDYCKTCMRGYARQAAA